MPRSCQDAVDRLWEYVRGELHEGDTETVERRLDHCLRCCGEVVFVCEVVRRAYAALPAGGGAPVAERLYRAEDLARVPQAAVDWALGVGDPVGASDLAPGETVLDVGCGGGIDSILAGHRVGPEGSVIGLDLLPEMCERAAKAAAAAGTGEWSRFEVGAMEEVPLPDGSVDVVVTNGVLNLSPRRSRALLELARVLRPGGRLWAADLTVEADLPSDLRLDRGPQPLRPGDAFRVNPNDRHAIVNDGTEPLRLVCMDCLLE